MSGIRSRTAWTTGLLAVTVLAGVLTGPATQAVTGDAADAGVSAFAAKLDIGGGQRSCTGTLLNNQWLITSSSCFADDPALPLTLPAGAPKLKTTATIGRTDLTGTTGAVRQIVDLVPRQDRDLVLAKLDTPVSGIRPLHPAITAPVSGQSLMGAGYGRTKDTWVPDTLHTAAFTAHQVDATTVGIDGTAICKGDTGAPVFRDVDGNFELAAVASTSWQGGCLGSDETRTGAVATRVDDINAWIRQATAVTATPWKLQMLATTNTGLYHTARDSNGDWLAFGDVQQAAGSIGEVKVTADAAINGKNYVFAIGGNAHLYEGARLPNGSWEKFRDLTAETGALPGLTKIAVTSTGNGLSLIALANGRIYHNVQDANGKWIKWGDVTAALGVLGNATQVTTSQTGTETQIGVVADKKAFHAIRHANGTWTAWGELKQLTATLGPVSNMAFAGTGTDLQVVVTNATGGIQHGIRAANGTWGVFGDLSPVLGKDPVTNIDAAAVDGELQTVVVTADGHIKHTLRHVNRTWDAADEPSNIPGTPTTVAITGSWN
ncbi:S1 family peptidase [Streptomyces sp. RKAG293]|uniref:S1 family peptidase n=1 Tax=Streptomyces sp. RKAG293 TaxID=2893403 RepID=UPI0020342685|nr:S1 family peptidase [Streptomyces sp. RKAG293]MCM2423909.1 S1 family peptidase [Streptomyces sp. RKAG293]